jgi:uncharacterized membrane protein YphA (DoxX/SURF4 family)
VASLFFFAFSGKVTNYDFMVGLSTQMGIPFAGFFMPFVMALEVVGGLSLLFNRYVWVSALLLAGYIIFVTPFFHFDWTDPVSGPQHAVSVFDNLAIIGGLFALYAMDPSRPGRLKQAGF